MDTLSASVVVKLSIFVEGEREALRHKWIESEKAGHDLGEAAIRSWVQEHWDGYLRARWIEHVQGLRFWVELDRGDFGLLKWRFPEHNLMLDRILDRLKCGYENLNIIGWALDFNVTMCDVIEILTAFDINSRRLVARFGPCP